MADRAVTPSINGKLCCDIFFYREEAELWRNGGVAGFLTMLAATAKSKLDYAGGYGPYLFFVRYGDGVMNPYSFHAEEQ